MRFNSALDCLKFLKDDLKYDFIIHQHDPVYNMDEMSKKVPLKNSPFIKCLFFYDKKDMFYLVLAKSDT